MESLDLYGQQFCVHSILYVKSQEICMRLDSLKISEESSVI